MLKSEKASLSVRKITFITVLLLLFFSVGVMATSVQVNNVKIILSNNYEMDVLTTKTKVSDILNENHIIILPDENVVPNQDSDISENKTITITKTLENGESVIKLAEENNQVTVEQILGNYTPVVEKIVTEQVAIPFETVTKDSGTITGETTNKVLKEGKDGLKEITYKAKYKNDVEIERIVLSEIVIAEPINKVVQVTKTAVTSRANSTRTVSDNPAKKSTNTLAKRVEGKTPVIKTFNTSAYCSCSKCCGKSTGLTSSGAKATSWYTLAAGSGYPMGTVIYIPSLKNKPNGGWFVVQDRGGAISNNKLDVYLGSHTQAIQFGRKTLEAYVYM